MQRAEALGLARLFVPVHRHASDPPLRSAPGRSAGRKPLPQRRERQAWTGRGDLCIGSAVLSPPKCVRFLAASALLAGSIGATVAGQPTGTFAATARAGNAP